MQEINEYVSIDTGVGAPNNTLTFADEWTFTEHLMGMKSMRTMYVHGPPGIGKTYTACRSGLGNRDVHVLTLTPETPAAEMRGFFVPKGGEFAWQDGPFVKAMRDGARVVINEVSHASHDVLAILYPVLESAETAGLTLPDCTTVVPARGFQVICTDNMGPEDLPPALKDRFNAVVEITEAHPSAIALLRKGLQKAAEQTMTLQDDRAVSLRAWLTVQEVEKEIGTPNAFRAVFGADRGAELFQATALGSETGN